ncbi:MAG TPA: pilin [Gammaproteobacteria bacterium]|nr:pilin [Gammaproteobacteria bacterium]
MKRTQQGFTLIELMIVVAIIGILAAIAIPQYQNYVARSQVSEAPTLIDGAKTTIESYIAQNGSFPSNLSSLGVRVSGKYVASLAAAPQGSSGAGTVTVTFRSTGTSPKIHGDTLVWQRDTSGVWNCAGVTGQAATKGTLPTKFVPGTCK